VWGNVSWADERPTPTFRRAVWRKSSEKRILLKSGENKRSIELESEYRSSYALTNKGDKRREVTDPGPHLGEREPLPTLCLSEGGQLRGNALGIGIKLYESLLRMRPTQFSRKDSPESEGGRGKGRLLI